MRYVRYILKRPVSVMLIILAVVVFGISSIFNTRLEYFPDVTMPMQLVYVICPGADADAMERLVTQPVEDVGKTLKNIEGVSSYSFDNYAMIQFTYGYGTDLDEAYMDLKEGLDSIVNELPEDCETPVIMEIGLDMSATFSVAVQSVDGRDIANYVKNTIVPKIETLDGVAQVDVIGANDKYYRIVLNEEKMAQYGLDISTVATFIGQTDFEMPLGSVTTGTQSVGMSSTTGIDWETQMGEVSILTARGAVIKLSDIADFMSLYQEDIDSVSRYNGNESVIIDVTSKSTSPTIEMCNSVMDTLNELKIDGIEYQIIRSTADDIKDTLMEVFKTLVQGVIFTMVILLLFFGDLKASLVVGTSMPLSLLAAFSLLKLAGISFDMMTGTGMVIAIGMIVDNSIVILESCFRMREEGLSYREAAVKGTGTMLMSVFASTLTTVVVYAPILLADGMAGQMMIPLCSAIIFTMTASLISSVTVIPTFFIRYKPVEKKELPINKVLDSMKKGYAKALPYFLHRPKRTLLVSVILLIVSVIMVLQLQFDLFPNNYDGSMKVTVSFRSGTLVETMDERIRGIENALASDENFESVSMQIVEGQAILTAYSSDTCKRSSEDAVEYYTNEFSKYTNMDINIEPMGVTTGLASLMTTGNNVTITLVGDDMDNLEKGSYMVEEAMKQVPGVLKISNDFTKKKSTAKLVIDHQLAASYGLTPASISMQVYYVLSDVSVTTIEIDDTEYDVRLEYPQDRYDDVTNLMNKLILNPNGQGIPLNEVATIEFTDTLQTIMRKDNKYLTTIKATTTSDSKYAVSDTLKALVAEIDFPEGVKKGESEQDKIVTEEVMNVVVCIAVAVFLVFLVMAMQFESVKFSLMVMTCIPFSMIGSFGLLYMTNYVLSMMAMLGLMMLVGMVVNNGILLIDGTNELKKTMPLEEALVEAGLTRLRPILMTTLTTVISMIPLVISGNSGLNMMFGMGIVIIGGLCTSTILAMFLMPPFYVLLDKVKSVEEDEV